MYNTLYEIYINGTKLIDDNTRIIVRGYKKLAGCDCKLADGNWYNDDVLEYAKVKIHHFMMFPEDNEITIHVGNVEELDNNIYDLENVEESLEAYASEESAKEEYYQPSPLEDWLFDGQLGGALKMLAGYAK